MNKKIGKIIIIIIVILLSIIGIMYLIDLDRMKNGKEVVFSTWGAKYAPIEKNIINENKEKQNTNDVENYQKYSKTIDNIKIELSIPNDWKYEETKPEKDSKHKFELKLYKSSKNDYATLVISNDLLGVCGTGLTTKRIKLNNGQEAGAGYYDNSEIWSHIGLKEKIFILNYGLKNMEANEVLDFVKTINIINDNIKN